VHLHHADRADPELDIEEGLLHVGRLINQLNTCNNLEFEMEFNGSNQRLLTELADSRDKLFSSVNTLPDPDRFNEFNLTCTPDTFLEILMGSIRHALISFQAWIIKVRNAKKSRVILQINNLKKDFIIHADKIFLLERELTAIRDEELSSVIRDIKLFEHLHNEKPSPLYLNLIKHSAQENLSCIKDDRGNCFNSEQDCNKHIVEHFEKVYSTPDTKNFNYVGCVERFLGADICNYPTV
jgi:hypothetical protein